MFASTQSASPRRQALALSGASALQALATMVAAILTTMLLGTHERGLVVLGGTIAGILALVGGLGTGTALRTALPVADERGRQALVSAYSWCTALCCVGVGALSAVLSALSAPLIDPAMGSRSFLCALALYTGALFLGSQLVEAWFAEGDYRRAGLCSAKVALGSLLGAVGVLALSRAGWLVLAGQAAGALLACMSELPAQREAGLVRFGPARATDVQALIRRGVPVLGMTAGLTVAMRADRFILGVVAGPAAVAVYSLAATVAEAPRIVSLALSQMYLRTAALGAGAAELFRATRTAVAASVVSCALVGLVAAPAIVPIFGAEFAQARSLTLVLLLAEICMAPHLIASMGLLGGSWNRTACAIGLVGAVGAIAIYAVGASLAGSSGLVAGSVLLYAGLSVASWTLLQRRLREPREACHA